jgi:hypothetical protein
MITRLKLKPGQKGTKKLVDEYGDALVLRALPVRPGGQHTGQDRGNHRGEKSMDASTRRVSRQRACSRADWVFPKQPEVKSQDGAGKVGPECESVVHTLRQDQRN